MSSSEYIHQSIETLLEERAKNPSQEGRGIRPKALEKIENCKLAGKPTEEELKLTCVSCFDRYHASCVEVECSDQEVQKMWLCRNCALKTIFRSICRDDEGFAKELRAT